MIGNDTFLFRIVQPEDCFDLSSRSIDIDIVIPLEEKQKELVLSQLDISSLSENSQNSSQPAKFNTSNTNSTSLYYIGVCVKSFNARISSFQSK